MARIGITEAVGSEGRRCPHFECGLTVAGIAGRDPERTRRLGGELHVETFVDWRDLVARPDVDLVSIVTPPADHLEMALAALEAGKHVLSEKPTALNAEEAEKMNEAASVRPGRSR